jgi:sugar/nucleoside kinase (ribokinase family)
VSVLVVGSVAYDSIKSPAGEKERCLGGSATYFSLAASFFTQVRVVAVVGEDFSDADEKVLSDRGVDTSGIQRKEGKTFFWSGEYGENLSEAKTRTTELNVFESFNPQISEDFRSSEYLFLANIDPVLQSKVRQQMNGARLVGGDTMNFWINGKPKELEDALRIMDVLLINDTEARSLGADPSLPRAAQKILAKGPRVLVIKHGEFGATAFFREGGLQPFRAPAMPIEEVLDPTGAGDCFAGGFMGYIASQEVFNREVLKRAMFYGGVMGSFAVERFGTQRLQELTREEIDARFQYFRELSHLE